MKSIHAITLSLLVLSAGWARAQSPAPVPQPSPEQIQRELDRTAESAEKGQNPNDTPEGQEWLALLDYVADNGKMDETQVGVYVTLIDASSTDRTAARLLSHLSVIGGVDSQGVMQFTRVEEVWEDWTLTAEGNLRADQWMFLISRDGQLARTWHYILVKNKNDRILEHTFIKSTPAEYAAKWKTIRAAWVTKMKAAPAAEISPAAPAK